MWTGKWWWSIQKLCPPGATLCPIIIATDKTNLTQFSSGIYAYPIYLTIGNIPKLLQCKPTKQACVLLGYLPAESELLKGITLSKKNIGSRHQELFHSTMCHILTPLIKAGTDDVDMTSGNSEVQCVHPGFVEVCMKDDVSGSVSVPFCTDFPFTNIHNSLTPDVLHQLYQGVVKYLIEWSQTLLTNKELDVRIRSLPPVYGVHYFDNGFSVLSQISSLEQKEMVKIPLGCLVGIVPDDALVAFKALLDFIYLACQGTPFGPLIPVRFQTFPCPSKASHAPPKLLLA
ncbi:hypothetical protein CPB83DRAFT_778694 [Crepidotus variabilis]|uniref:Uncharacterized protein n=1 Tax=Crepidotus variabilis TaxID=179855 RepID=A0A9P6BC85_9AGAR|nr:hypothetical protein CPB83DRAFT_778694 [Crepidotus variabilis]